MAPATSRGACAGVSVKLALTGDKLCIGDILKGIWFFPNGIGEIVSLVPFEGKLLEFAGAGSQIASIKGSDRKLTLPATDWYIVYREEIK